MSQADSNRVRYSIVEEVSPSVLPGSPTGNVFRNTSPEFALNKDTVTSDEIRSDTRNADVIEVGAKSEGTLGYELSMASFNSLIEAVVGSTFSTPVDNTDTISVTAGTGAYAGTSSPFAGLVVGQWVYFSGFSNAGNNGWKRILTKTDDDNITVATTGLVDEVGDADENVKGSMLRDGTNIKTFSVERSYLDINFHELFQGQRVGSWSVDASAGAIVSGSFGFMGEDLQTSDSASFMTGGFNAAGANPVVNATNNLGDISINGSALTTAIKSINMNYDRSLAEKQATRNRVPIGYRLGTMQGSGSVSAYFEDGTLYDRFLNHEYFQLSFAFEDPSGRRLRISFDRVVFSSGGSPSVPGKDQDVMQNLDWESMHSDTYDCQIQVDYIA